MWIYLYEINRTGAPEIHPPVEERLHAVLKEFGLPEDDPVIAACMSGLQLYAVAKGVQPVLNENETFLSNIESLLLSLTRR